MSDSEYPNDSNYHLITDFALGLQRSSKNMDVWIRGAAKTQGKRYGSPPKEHTYTSWFTRQIMKVAKRCFALHNIFRSFVIEFRHSLFLRDQLPVEPAM